VFGVSEELSIVEVFSHVCVVDELRMFLLELLMCSCVKLVASWHPCKWYTGEFIASGKHWFVDNQLADIFALFFFHPWFCQVRLWRLGYSFVWQFCSCVKRYCWGLFHPWCSGIRSCVSGLWGIQSLVPLHVLALGLFQLMSVVVCW
jgi:hypothetical protein